MVHSVQPPVPTILSGERASAGCRRVSCRPGHWPWHGRVGRVYARAQAHMDDHPADPSVSSVAVAPRSCTAHAAQCPQRFGGGLVFREIKERRRKTIPLPPELAELLREHRQAQDAERELAANEWREHYLVFCQPDGAPIDNRADCRSGRTSSPKPACHTPGRTLRGIPLPRSHLSRASRSRSSRRCSGTPISGLPAATPTSHGPSHATPRRAWVGRFSGRSEPKNVPTTHDH